MELKVIPQKQEEEVYFLEQEHNSNKTALAFLKKAFQRYFIDAMGAMALGLFSSLIIGLILSQLSKFSFLGFLQPYADMVGASSPVVGAAIGVAIAYGCLYNKSIPLNPISKELLNIIREELKRCNDAQRNWSAD